MERATLYIGATCEDVKILKTWLSELGYRVNMSAGDYDVKTRSAVEAFQNDAGLRVDGIVGEKTWRALEGECARRGVSTEAYSVGGAAAFKGDLSEGCRGERVLALQQKLKALGYYNGPLDGIFGAETERAVRAFQADAGLKVDGIVGDYTWGALFGASAAKMGMEADGGELSEGCRGERVVSLQKQLAALGFYHGSIDGIFGSETAAAVRAFQGSAGIAMDGVVGEQTWTALFETERGTAYVAAKPPAAVGAVEGGGRVRAELEDYPGLWYGDYGNYVKELQDRLHSSRHYNGHSTGVFDEETKRAVCAFQKECGVFVDGVVRKEVWKLLNVGR